MFTEKISWASKLSQLKRGETNLNYLYLKRLWIIPKSFFYQYKKNYKTFLIIKKINNINEISTIFRFSVVDLTHAAKRS